MKNFITTYVVCIKCLPSESLLCLLVKIFLSGDSSILSSFLFFSLSISFLGGLLSGTDGGTFDLGAETSLLIEEFGLQVRFFKSSKNESFTCLNQDQMKVWMIQEVENRMFPLLSAQLLQCFSCPPLDFHRADP